MYFEKQSKARIGHEVSKCMVRACMHFIMYSFCIVNIYTPEDIVANTNYHNLANDVHSLLNIYVLGVLTEKS